MPGKIDDLFEDGTGTQDRRDLSGRRFDQVVVVPLFHRLHEGIGDGDAEIEVVEAVRVFLGGDEIHDVGVIDPQNPHIGAAPLAALLDRLGRRIEDGGKGQRPRGDALGRTDGGVLRAQTGEGVAGAAAGLVHQGAVADGGEDAVHRVLDRQDETGRQLAEIGTGIHQAGGIGQKIHAIDQVEKGIAQRPDLLGFPVDRRHRPRHPAAQRFPGLGGVAFGIFQIVPPGQYRLGGTGQHLFRQIRRHLTPSSRCKKITWE